MFVTCGPGFGDVPAAGETQSTCIGGKPRIISGWKWAGTVVFSGGPRTSDRDCSSPATRETAREPENRGGPLKPIKLLILVAESELTAKVLGSTLKMLALRF